MKKRIFIAIPLPESMQKVLDEYKKDIEVENAKIRWVRKDNLHITALFLGEVEEGLITTMVGTLEAIATNTESFTLKLQEIKWAPSDQYPRMIWAKFENDENYINLIELMKKSLEQYFGLQIFDENQTIIPHVTMARIKNAKDIKPAPLKQIVVDDLFVSSFQLIESELSSDGPEYTIISDFPL